MKLLEVSHRRRAIAKDLEVVLMVLTSFLLAVSKNTCHSTVPGA